MPAGGLAVTLLCLLCLLPAVPIFDGQLSAIAAELEGLDPEECQIQVGRLPGRLP